MSILSVIIYGIQCKVNNKIYIGQTSNYTARIYNHKNELNKHNHSNPFLQKDWIKYGADNFEFIILEDNVVSNQRLEKETYYMNKYGGTNSANIYNVKGNFNDDNTEYHLSKVKAITDKHDWFKGCKHPEETKSKISKSLKLAYKQHRHTLPSKRFGQANSFYGKHHTAETKKKLSEQHTKYNADYINNLRALKLNGMRVVDIARMYNINPGVAGCLINYGTSSRSVINKLRKSKNKV